MSPAKLVEMTISSTVPFPYKEQITLTRPVMTPIPIPTPSPGAAKNATPLPKVPNSIAPMLVTMAPYAAYLAYRMSRRIA